MARPLVVLNAVPVAAWQKLALAPRQLLVKDRSLDPCRTCAGTCCQFIVQLSAVEAVRMALTLSLPLEDIVEAMPYEPDTAGQRGYHAIATDAGKVMLVLRRAGEARACVLRYSVGARGRCGAYSVRPGQCRMYPLHVEEEDGTQVRIGTDAYCPTGWVHDDDTALRLRDHLDRWRADIARDAVLCRRWARRKDDDRSLAAFFRFAAFELADELGLDPAALYPPPRRRLGDRARGVGAPPVELKSRAARRS
ncbi:MAG TPA: YkgJ family cysteine cluster protein [Gemmatimonadales bacterium]|nr:YkgJ family cysteine cluster protein [Gemmatimonadales bacterium]